MLHSLFFVLIWTTATRASFFSKMEDPACPPNNLGDMKFWASLMAPSDARIYEQHSGVQKTLAQQVAKEIVLLLNSPQHGSRVTEAVEESLLPNNSFKPFSPDKHLYCDSNSQSFENVMISPNERVHIFSANYPLNYPVNTRCGMTIWGQHSQRPRITCPDVSMGPGDSLSQIHMFADHPKITHGQDVEVSAIAPVHGINLYHLSDDKHTAKGFHCVVSLGDSID